MLTALVVLVVAWMYITGGAVSIIVHRKNYYKAKSVVCPQRRDCNSIWQSIPLLTEKLRDRCPPVPPSCGSESLWSHSNRTSKFKS